MRFSLIGNSLDLFFEEGVDLHLAVADTPYLTWKDGSCGPDVPTPQASWLALSFSGARVPVVLGFSGETRRFKMSGKAGDWTLECPEFSGWLRLMLPQGDVAMATPDSGSLGVLANSVAKEEQHWSVPTPRVEKVTVTSDDLGLDATWTFDGPGAAVPPAITLAQLGGYPLSIRSPYHEEPGSADLGPISYVDGNVLTVHFPARRIRPGRALGVGPATESEIGSASPQDIPSVVDLAFESLLAHRDSSLAKLADDTSARYLEDAPYYEEPFTKQQMPFQSDGTGADLAAAEALLMQATSDAVNSTEPNSLLDSLGMMRDWWTWRVWTADVNVGRRANALSALAGALSQSDGARLMGATLEAGIDAEDGMRKWRARFGIASGPEMIQPLKDVRSCFFALKGSSSCDAFFSLLESPLRVGIGGGLELSKAGAGLELQWSADDTKPSVLTFLDPVPAGVKAGTNLARFTIEPAKSCLSLYYVPSSAGTCGAIISLPNQSPPVPAQAKPPDYTE
jgi:hypothetical protein